MLRSSATRTTVVFLAALAAPLLVLVSRGRTAERPAAPKLLPADTLAYLRIPDSRDLVDRFNETAIGRMSRQEQMQPLVTDLFGAAARAFKEAEEELGVSLAELLSIPQGEVVVALVAPPDGQPALIVLLDVGESRPVVEKLIERGEAEMAQDGWARTSETLADCDVVVHRREEGELREIVHCFMDDTLTIATNLTVAADLLGRFSGDQPEDSPAPTDDTGDSESHAVLADNDKFVAVMNRCKGSKDARPQLTWFVDPIELARVGARGNVAAQAGLAIVPVLGLDGIQGLGGSLTLATERFDVVFHVHLLLDTPRTGIIEMVAFRPGDMNPEPWVPHDVASYTTLNWDVDVTYRTMTQLYDSFSGEGGLSKVVQRRVSDQIGVDFEKEILPAIEGRVTILAWFEPPASMGSRARLVAVKLNDAKQFQSVLEKIVAKFPETLEKKTYSSATYYQVAESAMRRMRLGRRGQRPTADGEQPQPPPPGPAQARVQPCMGIVGDYLIAADRPSFFEKVVLAKADASRSLASDLEFKLIASKIRRQPGGTHPALVTFDRPEMALRMVYDLVASDETRTQLTERAADNEFFGAVDKALRDNPLPPFAVLQQYLAPGGGMITDDETGLHYMGFTLRRD
jgi:hypothetical protein